MKVRKCMEQLTQNIKEPSVINKQCVEYADLLFGVGSATSAGPCVPNGSIHPSPETLEKQGKKSCDFFKKKYCNPGADTIK